MAQVGFGTKLEYKAGAGAWTELSDVLEIAPGRIVTKAAKYMPIKASSNFERALPGTLMVDPWTFKIVWTSAIETLLSNYQINRDTTLQWRITRSNTSSTQAIAGFISGLSEPIATDEVDVMDVEITVDGGATFA
jgi:hypothetical protein